MGTVPMFMLVKGEMSVYSGHWSGFIREAIGPAIRGRHSVGWWGRGWYADPVGISWIPNSAVSTL